jgi:hypothetical protein
MIQVKVISNLLKQGSRWITAMRYGKNDVVEAKQAAPYGVDSVPVKDMIAIYAPTTTGGSEVIIGYINKNQLADIGEHRTYSTNEDGDVKFYIWMKNDGTCLINGNADNAVRYSPLETGFNQLKSDFNELVNKWNTFCAAYIPGSPVTIGSPATLSTSTVTASSATISGAKITEIKTM